MSLKISVVVPTHNEEKMICSCLEALNNQTLPRDEYEIIVSDGLSTDDTVNIARELADHVFTGHSPVGAARDYGLKRARAPLVAFTDADTLVPPDWLETFIKAFENPEVVGAFGGVGYIESGILPQFYELMAGIIIGIGKYFMPFFHGFNICVRCDAALRVGGVPKKRLGEDSALGFALMKIGRIVYAPTKVKTSFRRIRRAPIKTLLIWSGFYELMMNAGIIKKVNYEVVR